MGSSKSRPGIFISTNKAFYLPGQLVQGNIYINAPKAYPSSRILLNITGSEKTFWKSTQSKQKNSKQNSDKSDQSMVVINKKIIPNQKQYKKSKNLGQDRMGQIKIMQINYTLSVWSQDHTLHGQYAFPFTFHLPSFLPASFKDQTPQYKASIGYQISCISISPKKQFTNLIQTQQIIIRIPQKKQTHALHGQLYLTPKNCCCCSLGASKISCHIEKNQYQQNQQCTAYCQIDNYKGNYRIKLIKVKLNKITTLSSNQGQQITFSQQLNQADFPGIQPHQQYLGESAQKITFALKYKKSSIGIPPTTKGKLIKCQYLLQLTPILAGCCMNNNIYFTVPLEIVQQGIKPIALQAPSDWSPQVFGKSQIFADGNVSSNDKLECMINPYY